jgi:hypothetical protein
MWASALAAAALSVQAMVVGQSGAIVSPARTVRPAAFTVTVAHGRRCAVGAATPLAELQALRVHYSVRDYASCSRNPRDAGGLFVYRVAGQANSGADGWVYKINQRAGTAGAGDPAARVRPGQQVLWFWCHMTGGSCQHTLGLSAALTGQSVAITVLGYDDNGHGTAVAGAQVSFAGASATSGPDGVATFTAAPGSYTATATANGLVPAFPLQVAVP